MMQKNPNFGAGVSKEQTTQLLGKLYRAGIIENVREDANDDEFKVNNFNQITNPYGKVTGTIKIINTYNTNGL